MKYFFALAMLTFMSCNYHPGQNGGGTTLRDTASHTQTQSQPVPATPPPVYNDNITVVSMSNSVSTAKVNDVLIINLQVENTGNDVCNMCNAEISYRLNDAVSGNTILVSSVDNISPVNNILAGQSGNVVAKFPITQAGNYTFVIHDLFGVFKGTNLTRHFNVSATITTSLSVSQ